MSLAIDMWSYSSCGILSCVTVRIVMGGPTVGGQTTQRWLHLIGSTDLRAHEMRCSGGAILHSGENIQSRAASIE